VNYIILHFPASSVPSIGCPQLAVETRAEVIKLSKQNISRSFLSPFVLLISGNPLKPTMKIARYLLTGEAAALD
jgi:hypothetical protein